MQPSKKYLRYSLRALLVLMTGVAVILGYYTESIRAWNHERQASKFIARYASKFDKIHRFQLEINEPPPEGKLSSADSKLLGEYLTNRHNFSIHGSFITRDFMLGFRKGIGGTILITGPIAEPNSLKIRKEYGISRLILNNDAVNEHSLQAISEIPRLRTLIIEDAVITVSSFANFSESKIEELRIKNCKISPDALHPLIKMVSLEELYIDCSASAFNQEDIKALAKHPYLRYALLKDDVIKYEDNK